MGYNQHAHFSVGRHGVFGEHFTAFCETYENNILALQKQESYNEAISCLFFQTQELKAMSSAIELSQATKVLKVLEDIFHILRHRKNAIKQELLDWLLMLYDFFSVWSESFEEDNYDIEPIDQYVLNMVKTSSLSTTQKNASLKERNVLVYTKHPKIVEFFKKLGSEFNALGIAPTLAKTEEVLKGKRIDFLLVTSDAGIDEITLLQQLVSARNPAIPLIPIVMPKDSSSDFIRMIRKINIFSYIDGKIDPQVVLQTLQTLVKLVYDPAWVSIPSALILDQINGIAPLPEVITKLQEMIASDETSSRDIATLLQTEPVLTAKILQTINTPSFGLAQNISTLHHAVSLLGKCAIGALVLQEKVFEQFGASDLTMYGIDQQRFYAVTKRRMDLMSKWYTKVNLSMMPVLATTALLGNIGMFILSAAAKKRGIEKEFYELARLSGHTVAEAELFNMTSEEVTAALLDYWKLNPLIGNAIRYSLDFQNAHGEVKPYAIANFVVYTLMNSTDENLSEEAFNDMHSFVKDLNFDVNSFRAAYEAVAKTT